MIFCRFLRDSLLVLFIPSDPLIILWANYLKNWWHNLLRPLQTSKFILASRKINLSFPTNTSSKSKIWKCKYPFSKKCSHHQTYLRRAVKLCQSLHDVHGLEFFTILAVPYGNGLIVKFDTNFRKKMAGDLFFIQIIKSDKCLHILARFLNIGFCPDCALLSQNTFTMGHSVSEKELFLHFKQKWTNFNCANWYNSKHVVWVELSPLSCIMCSVANKLSYHCSKVFCVQKTYKFQTWTHKGTRLDRALF